MVYLRQTDSISHEARALIEAGVEDRADMYQLAALLPEEDPEVIRWIESAIEQMDGGMAARLFYAAALDGRALPASLLPAMMFIDEDFLRINWVAWRMTGNVAEEVLRGLENTRASDHDRAALLSVAAAWWKEHHPGEEFPRQIVRLALKIWENNPDEGTATALMDLGLITDDPALKRRAAKAGISLKFTVTVEKRLEGVFAYRHLPFADYFCERASKSYTSNLPQRRSVAKIGNNNDCRCGSGKKYKKCCRDADRVRLRDSSSIAGVTRKEMFQVPGNARTKEWLDALRPTDLAWVELHDLPQELHADYLSRLLDTKQYDEAMGVFRALGVTEKLRDSWCLMLEQLGEAWRPDLARELYYHFRDAEKLGLTPNAGLRFLMVGDDPAAAFQDLDSSLVALLEAGDAEELQDLVTTVMASPYRGLGIFLVRSLLPIVEEKNVSALYEGILDARAKLNLPLEDEFSDWMDEHTLREARGNETDEAQEAADKLEAVMEETRALVEERAKLVREARLREQQERRELEQNTTRSAVEIEQARERERTLKAANERLSAVLREKNKEKLRDRRLAQKKSKEEKQRAAAVEKESAPENEDEEYKVEGNQPLRLIRFPKDFRETLAKFPKYVGRATMNRLGWLRASPVHSRRSSR